MVMRKVKFDQFDRGRLQYLAYYARKTPHGLTLEEIKELGRLAELLLEATRQWNQFEEELEKAQKEEVRR